MSLVARLLGAVLLVAWPVGIMAARRVMLARGSVVYSTVFQFGILPFLTGGSMLATGRVLFLAMAAVAWLLAWAFPKFFLYALPLVWGWVLGQYLAPATWSKSGLRVVVAGVAGAVVVFLLCSVVVAAITSPPRAMATRK